MTKRILLKISGEALMGHLAYGLDPQMLDFVVSEIGQALDEAEASGNPCQLALVVGGGNIFRGVQGAATVSDRTRADNMGMLATIMNALALEDAFERHGRSAVVLSGLEVPRAAETFTARGARQHLAAGRVVLFAGGTGSPFFTTDTGAALRASEIGATLLCKATKVDGVYDADPVKHSDATKFARLTLDECISRRLAVMDQTAFSMCRDNNIPILVFSLNTPGNIAAALNGRDVGTLVLPR